MQIIASGLTTLPTAEVILFGDYCTSHVVEPVWWDSPSKWTIPLLRLSLKSLCLSRLAKKPPELVIVRHDGATSVAFNVLDGGLKKKNEKKRSIDKISATLLLQSFLDASLHSKKK